MKYLEFIVANRQIHRLKELKLATGANVISVVGTKSPLAQIHTLYLLFPVRD